MRNLLVNLSLALLGVLVAFVLLEFSLRVFFPRPQVIQVTKDETITSDAHEQKAISLAERVDEETGGLYINTPTGRKLRPNTVATIKNHYLCKCQTEIRTNSLGYRNREIGEKENTRVLFLGDSITMADYIPEERTWVRLVEQLSQKTARPLETINAGVFAIGLANELAILVETGLSTNPDVVVLGWYLNDAQPSPGIDLIKVPERLSWSWLAQYAYQGVSVLRSKAMVENYGQYDYDDWQIWGERTKQKFPPEGDGPPQDSIGGYNRVLNNLFFDWGSAYSDDVWNFMKPYFVELKRLSEVHGFELYIVAFPVADQVYADFDTSYPQRKLQALAAELGVPVLDLLPKLREAFLDFVKSGRPQTKELFYDWCHHTPHGNELIANWVHEFVQDNLS